MQTSIVLTVVVVVVGISAVIATILMSMKEKTDQNGQNGNTQNGNTQNGNGPEAQGGIRVTGGRLTGTSETNDYGFLGPLAGFLGVAVILGIVSIFSQVPAKYSPDRLTRPLSRFV